MAAVGAEVMGILTSGVVGFFVVLLLLSIFLSALCSECSRHSFELRDSEADKDPSALIRVVKLEEASAARENPMISEIQNDEKEFNGEGIPESFTPWRSHLRAPPSHQGVRTNGTATAMMTSTDSETAGGSNPEEETSLPPWRSHLNQDVNSSISGGADVSSAATNPEPGKELSARSALYTRVSKKVRPATPPVGTPEEEDQEELEEEEQEEEEASPPLPDRKT